MGEKVFPQGISRNCLHSLHRISIFLCFKEIWVAGVLSPLFSPATEKNREGEKIIREGDFLKREDNCSEQIVSRRKS